MQFLWIVMWLLSVLSSQWANAVDTIDTINASADIIHPACTLNLDSPVSGKLNLPGTNNSTINLNYFLSGGVILADNTGGHDIEFTASCPAAWEPIVLVLESPKYVGAVDDDKHPINGGDIVAHSVFGNWDPNTPGAVGIGVVAHMSTKQCYQDMSFSQDGSADCVAQRELFALPLSDAQQPVNQQKVFVRVGLAAVYERAYLRTGNISVPLTFRMEFQ